MCVCRLLLPPLNPRAEKYRFKFRNPLTISEHARAQKGTRERGTRGTRGEQVGGTFFGAEISFKVFCQQWVFAPLRKSIIQECVDGSWSKSNRRGFRVFPSSRAEKKDLFRCLRFRQLSSLRRLFLFFSCFVSCISVCGFYFVFVLLWFSFSFFTVLRSFKPRTLRATPRVRSRNPGSRRVATSPSSTTTRSVCLALSTASSFFFYSFLFTVLTLTIYAFTR